MLFLTDYRLTISRKLSSSFAKARAAIERDDFRSPDVKKLTGRTFFRAKLDSDSRLLLQFVEREEKREAFRQDAIKAWDEYRLTGLHVTAAEADAWMAKLEAGQDVEPPECHG